MYRLFLYYQWFFQNIEKGWRKILEKRLFPHFLNMAKIIKMLPPAFFNILTEPLAVQKQTIHQQKGLDLSFLETEILRAWHYQEDATPSRRESIFYGRVFGF